MKILIVYYIKVQRNTHFGCIININGDYGGHLIKRKDMMND